ncbi:hypothetical protein AB0C76_26675 [Kitasatospora sp. NPDC048722]|uniref:hypothetical protein n=1 Tax=Kitasatospora sp. NPDC048722 TaxID=3155639 RepID=UPI0033D01790
MTALALRAATAVRAPAGPGPGEDDPALLAYFTDLLAPFGQKPDQDLYRGGAHLHHRDLVDLLLTDRTVAAARPDLAIVTHALPDLAPFTATAPYLTARLGGRATNFALTEQGLAAPFTALRIAAAYQKAGQATEVAIAVLEQTTLPTAHPVAPLTDSAALLVLRADAGPGPRFVGAHCTDHAGRALTARLDGPGADGTLLVLGPDVTDDIPDHPAVHRTAPGSYCTSLWLELAHHWQDWHRTHRRVVLCDTDPRTGRTHLAVFADGEE